MPCRSRTALSIDCHAACDPLTCLERGLRSSESAFDRRGQHDAAVGAAQRASVARSGCGIRPTTLRCRLQMPAMLLSEPLDVARAAYVAGGVGVAEDDLAVGLRARRARRDRRSSCLRRARSAAAAPVRRARGGERRVGLLDAHAARCCDTNLMRSLRTIAPGSRPASSSTWNPLQMPSTGPPRSANALTAAMIGEKRAMAPVRR